MKIPLREIIVYVWKEHFDDSFEGTPSFEYIWNAGQSEGGWGIGMLLNVLK